MYLYQSSYITGYTHSTLFFTDEKHLSEQEHFLKHSFSNKSLLGAVSLFNALETHQ